MSKFVISLVLLFSPVIVFADVLEESEAQELTQILEEAKSHSTAKTQGRQVVRINDKDNLVREIELKEVQEIEDRTPATQDEE